jgi:hypothetical protein
MLQELIESNERFRNRSWVAKWGNDLCMFAILLGFSTIAHIIFVNDLPMECAMTGVAGMAILGIVGGFLMMIESHRVLDEYYNSAQYQQDLRDSRRNDT